MQKLERAYMPESESEKAIADALRWFDKDPAPILHSFRLPSGTERKIVEDRLRKLIVEDRRDVEHYRNDTYQVAVYRNDKPASGWPHMIHLSIKRNDRQPLHDWRDLQEIKNQLVGPENEGIELYPAQSRVVDAANQYHLWVLSNPEIRLPIGFPEGLIADSIEGSISQQRPLPKKEAA